MIYVNENLVSSRMLRGWTREEAVRPIEKEVIEYDGTSLTLLEWCGLLQLHHEDTYFRIIRGHKLEDIVREETEHQLAGTDQKLVSQVHYPHLARLPF
jgi:hypothetical protein